MKYHFKVNGRQCAKTVDAIQEEAEFLLLNPDAVVIRVSANGEPPVEIPAVLDKRLADQEGG